MSGKAGGSAAGQPTVPCVVEDGSELYSFFSFGKLGIRFKNRLNCIAGFITKTVTM